MDSRPHPLLHSTRRRLAVAACALAAGAAAACRPDASPARGDAGSTSPRAAEAAAAATGRPADAPPARSLHVPLAPGLTIVSANRGERGDRENVVQVRDASADGALYVWRYRDSRSSGGTEEGSVERFVRGTDLAAAPRLNTVFTRQGREDTPGYTTFSVSRKTYALLLGEGRAPYTVTQLGEGPFGGALGGALGGVLASRVTYKGTLSLPSRVPEPFPVLLNGRRVHVAALRLRGEFAFQEKTLRGDYWVLADSAHPLLLKAVDRGDVWQTVRIDMPEPDPAQPTVERALERECRAELPGIYFGFASAELEAASQPALDTVAALLRRHPDWSLAVEGHTDSIGGAAANQALSLGRAEAVRAALLQRAGVEASRLSAAGFGATRPRESNGTLEGRARNRRVELARSCPAAGS